MRLLITGACGFVGSRIGFTLPESISGLEVFGVDNLLRPGSEINRSTRRIRLMHGDIRMRSDIEALPACDWVIDAAANPSVLAGVDQRSTPRQLNEHNLIGTLNTLEYCRQHSAGLIMLSTSRVYSIRELASLPMTVKGNAFRLDTFRPLPPGITSGGLQESFSTHAPVSLYGATKLASEIMAREYGHTFRFPVWINRCGVLAGAGQFGTAEQGIFSYWLHACAARRQLRYIGFGGHGYQVRDAMHPSDLARLIALQMQSSPPEDPVYNVGGGADNCMSLAGLTEWCSQQFERNVPVPDERPRPFDIPWVVMDNAKAARQFNWYPQIALSQILDEIAGHVRQNPDWLRRSGVL